MALTDTLTDIGDAIRTKEGTAELIPLADMSERILSLPSGGAEPPELGFVPTEWNTNGYITRGRWYGTRIPSGSFAGYSTAYAALKYLTTLDHDGVTGSIDSYAFYNCGSLTTADFPLATGSIDSYAFYNCGSLTTADFPLVTGLSRNAFSGCMRLTTADFPLVTGSIGSNAFSGCTRLTTADFPLVTGLSSFAFSGCTTLTALILRSETMCTLSNINAFTSTPIASGTGYVYVPAALVDGYKAATNWVTFADQIRAIEDYPEITGGAA